MKKLTPFLLAFLFIVSCKKTVTNPESLPNAYSNQQVGASANDMLSASKYTILNIQIQYMPGYELDATALSNATAYLNNICYKPGGINITQSEISANGDSLDIDQVAVIESQNRTLYTSGTTLALYVLVTGGYDTSGLILGVAYRNTSICLFGGNIFDNSGGTGEVSRLSLESSVLEHEFGHIMGLVNLGTPMQVFHQDTVHGYHCNNPNCLMYYAIDHYVSLGMLPGSIPTLDSNCMKDLEANGGK